MTPIDLSLWVNGLLMVVVIVGCLMLAALWQIRRDMDRWHETHRERVELLRQYYEDTRRHLESEIRGLMDRLDELQDERTFHP